MKSAVCLKFCTDISTRIVDTNEQSIVLRYVSTWQLRYYFESLKEFTVLVPEISFKLVSIQNAKQVTRRSSGDVE